MKTRKLIVLAIMAAMVAALALAGCGQGNKGQEGASSAPDAAPAATPAAVEWTSEAAVPVYRETMDSKESVTVRMLGDIPYMKIDEFYNQLYFTGADQFEQAKPMTVTHSGSAFETTAFDGTKGTFDTDADTFTCENLDKYTSAPYYTLFLADKADPSAPFVRVSGTEYTGDVTPKTADLKSYGIDLMADGDDLWVPLPTLECIFCSPNVYDIYYNGQGVYVSDGTEVMQPTSAKSQDENYYAFTANKRSAERATFDYGNLCFYVDNFYGFPASCRLAESIKADGLDKTLDQTMDGMNLAGVKEILHSADMKEYAFGLIYLFNFALDDGGHTNFTDISWLSKDDLAASKAKREEYGLTNCKTRIRSDETLEGLEATLGQLLDSGAFGGEKMDYADGSGFAIYMEQGDTAMYVVPANYNINRAGWTAYENGESTEMPKDSMGLFMQALDKAKANPEIKNFVVNIAMCPGGESGISTTISKIISGRTYRHQFNEFTGQDEVISYDVDVNFDRVFDEKDNEVTYPFKFAVVAAAPSYSAANYLANMAKDNGVCLLGETTGGGANNPQVTPESEGLTFNLSSRYKLMDKNNQHVDFGVEPDYVLTQEKDGAKDYSQYFDLATISQHVNEFYAK